MPPYPLHENEATIFEEEVCFLFRIIRWSFMMTKSIAKNCIEYHAVTPAIALNYALIVTFAITSRVLFLFQMINLVKLKKLYYQKSNEVIFYGKCC